MRKLFLMYGAPASGKSYILNKLRVEDYTIEVDKVRQLFTNSQDYLIENDNDYQMTSGISSQSDHQVWDCVYDMLENRMKRGQTTFVDATHLFKRAFTMYNKLRNKYGYKVYLIDCMNPYMQIAKLKGLDEQQTRDYLVTELIRHNGSRRNIDQVSCNVLYKYTDRYLSAVKQDKVPQWVHKLPVELAMKKKRIKLQKLDLSNIYKALGDYKLVDTSYMDKFKRIQVIGDIHGDYDALQKVFENHQKGDAYVFVGDYLDRGTKNVEVFNFITNVLKGNNLFFLEGNHETHWQAWETNQKKAGQFGSVTLIELLKRFGREQVDDSIHKFYHDIKDYLYFNFGGKRYLISHAGLDYTTWINYKDRLDLMNADNCYMGLGTISNQDPYQHDVDVAWNNEAPSDFINIHGHRNNFNHYQVGNSYNLTDDNNFRWVTITPDGIEKHEIERIDKPDFITQVMADPHIHHKELDSGIIANNFDEEAFRKNIWNSETVKARGLFTRGDSIVGRGFNKFFNLNQLPNETLESLSYPVVVERKWNGFLGVVFYDKGNQRVKIYSKGGGDVYSALAKKVIHQTGWYNKIRNYFKVKENQDTTILFEIIDPINDPHIELYDSVASRPLAIIQNGENGKVLTYDCIVNGVKTNKERAYIEEEIINNNVIATVNNLNELKEVITKYSQQYPLHEGLVLYGANKMLKIKSPFYLKAKELRNALGHGYKPSHWYYGAENWYKYCKENKIKEFTPQLVKDLYNRGI